MSRDDLSTTATQASKAAPQMSGRRRGAPGMGSNAKPRDFIGSLKRLAGMFRGQGAQLTLILVCTVTSVVLAVLVPWLLGKATDRVVQAVATSLALDFAGLARLLLLAALLQCGAVALNFSQAWLTNGLVQGISLRLRQQAQDKLAHLSLPWFDRQPHGEVLSRITNDIDNVSQSLQQLLSQLLMALLQVLGVFAMMLLLSPLLALAALAGILASVGTARWVAQRARPHFDAQWREVGALNGNVEENYTGHTLMKVFGHQQRARARFEDSNIALRDSAFMAQFMSGIMQPLMMFIGNLSLITVVAGGALRVLGGAMSIGQLQSFIQYIRQINQPISQIAGVAAVLQSAGASVERVYELLDAPELAADPAQAANLPAPRGHVVFEHVTFRYDPAQPLFEDVNLEALPGQTIAIVGPTGAGKTTLVNLLMRFYEIDGGRISLDGIDIQAFSREALRRHFGMVLQETWLFSGSIRDNIAYGKEDATEAQIQEAAHACHVDSFVRTLAHGYDTLLDENGSGLSAGQRQLLTIARAFIAQPSVLILDEATSSVDTRTELLVQRAMARLRAGRTSFVIAHRLSTIRDADVIVYMQAGNVLERGSHDALMASRGAYWRLYQSQFESGQTGMPPTESAQEGDGGP